MSGTTTERVAVRPLTRIVDDAAAVFVRRVETPKGARLEVEATRSGTAIRLDAVTLECLAWQDRSTFVDFLEPQVRTLPADALAVRRGTADAASALTRITNEFAHAELRTAESAGHEWLEVDAPRLGFAVRLNAVALEAITWQRQETFTELLRRRLEE